VMPGGRFLRGELSSVETVAGLEDLIDAHLARDGTGMFTP